MHSKVCKKRHRIGQRWVLKGTFTKLNAALTNGSRIIDALSCIDILFLKKLSSRNFSSLSLHPSFQFRLESNFLIVSVFPKFAEEMFIKPFSKAIFQRLLSHHPLA